MPESAKIPLIPAAAPTPPDPPVIAPELTRIENAQRLYEVFRMLWDDQVAYADTLRDKRKLYSAGIAVLFGFGTFRLAWYRNLNEVPIVRDWLVFGLLQFLLVLVMAIALAAAYFLYTEGSMIRLWAARRFPALRLHERWPFRQFQSTWGSMADHDDRGRAISAIDMGVAESERWIDAPQDEVWTDRAWKLRDAYEDLLTANNRVNARIKTSVALLVTSYAILFVAVCVYSTAAVKEVRSHESTTGNSSQDRSQPPLSGRGGPAGPCLNPPVSAAGRREGEGSESAGAGPARHPAGQDSGQPGNLISGSPARNPAQSETSPPEDWPTPLGWPPANR
ncbi:MAG: hypothetical protein WC718_01165 [Phycisphaerales bacterium]